MKKVLMFIVLFILVAIIIFGLLFYRAYDRATSNPSYETLEVRVDCKDYRIASVKEWEMMNFEVQEDIAKKGNNNYDIKLQKVCLDYNTANQVCKEACQNAGFLNVGWQMDNQVGQHVCECQR